MSFVILGKPMLKTMGPRIGLIWFLVLPLVAQGQQERRWGETLERISSGVVSIRVDITRAFDTEWNQSSQATGFVVDAKRGLILTNRHVVTPGPVVAQAVFRNQEEVDLVPVYRDPVHDFGFFKYDPNELKFIEPTALVLVPEAAKIGRDIRVIGNDAGEQLSILAGTIARLDREAPDYGRGQYNDFNTFYLQAASGTSGGSSGSPVIDIEGQVVALNAGANTSAASSFFLPLDRVARALTLVQADKPVSRGTLETVFVRKPYAELLRLGLRDETQAQTRASFPDTTGMLVVEQVLPGGSGDGVLLPGDILVAIEDRPLVEFVPLADVLDVNVGRTLNVTIERGGNSKTLGLEVSDLHGITPDEFLRFGDAVVNRLSYQQARHFNRPVEGVYVANPGYVLGAAAIPRGSVIVSVDGRQTRDLNDLEAVMAGIPDGAKASVRFITFDEPQTEKLRIISVDRRWFPSERCVRDDTLGQWPCRALEPGPGRTEPKAASTTFSVKGDKRVRRLARSLVLVNFDMPYAVSGVSERHYHGTGLIIDADKGWVVVDRNTVPVAMGDVRLTFAGSVEIPGTVVYTHPLHNLTIVGYDPKLIGTTPVLSAELSSEVLEPGDSVWVVGLKGDHKLHSQATEIASIAPVNFPLSRTMRFRDANLETLSVVNAPGDFDGVLMDQRGRVASLWSSFAYQDGRDLSQTNLGVPIELVQEMISLLERGEPLRSLEVEWRTMPLASARKLGLPQAWADTLEAKDPERRQLLAVVRTVAGSPSAAFFKPGDVLLAINDEPANTFREVERATQGETVKVSIFRDGEVLDEAVATVELDGVGIDRLVSWAGALLQAPHRALAAQRGTPPSGVYVAYFNYGSPASRYGLFAGQRIIEVNGEPTPDLETFVQQVSGREDRADLRLRTVTWNNVPQVITLQLDQRYWPAYELRRSADEWTRMPLASSESAASAH